MDQLHSCGFACSIDDFGKGYSSLGMFKNLNVDVLKIDALFFHNLETEEKDRLLVESIIQLVRQFGVKTVAEGIETREQIEILKHMRCDYIQAMFTISQCRKRNMKSCCCSCFLFAHKKR